MDKSIVEPFISPIEPLPTELTQAGRLRPNVQCLLCDIYGTLFISGSGDISIAQKKEGKRLKRIDKLLKKYSIDITSSALTESLYASIEATHCQAKLDGVDYPEVQIEMIWSKILPFNDTATIRSFAVEYEMTMNPVWPMPGLKALIHSCRKNGLRLGIISNAQFFTPYLFEWYLGQDLQTLGFDPQLIFFSYKYGWAKPSRFLFKLAAEKLENFGFSMDQVAYLGNDIRNDVAPAQAVGFQTILFAGDARSLRMRNDDPTCKNIDPDLRITHIDQLAHHLFRNKICTDI